MLRPNGVPVHDCPAGILWVFSLRARAVAAEFREIFLRERNVDHLHELEALPKNVGLGEPPKAVQEDGQVGPSQVQGPRVVQCSLVEEAPADIQRFVLDLQNEDGEVQLHPVENRLELEN